MRAGMGLLRLRWRAFHLQPSAYRGARSCREQREQNLGAIEGKHAPKRLGFNLHTHLQHDDDRGNPHDHHQQQGDQDESLAAQITTQAHGDGGHQ